MQFPAVETRDRLHRQMKTAGRPARYVGAVPAFGAFEKIGATHVTFGAAGLAQPLAAAAAAPPFINDNRCESNPKCGIRESVRKTVR